LEIDNLRENSQMRGQINSLPSVAFFCLTVLGPNLASAKVPAPPEVPPVVDGTVRYEAPPFDTPCDPHQNGGCVVAYDNTTNEQLWALKVYCTRYDPGLEQDVQDVFITSLTMDSQQQLQVANQRGQHFTISPATLEVTGDSRGCGDQAGGCCQVPGHPTQPSLWLALAMAVLVWARSLGQRQVLAPNPKDR
jgi:hypothetical protein